MQWLYKFIKNSQTTMISNPLAMTNENKLLLSMATKIIIIN